MMNVFSHVNSNIFAFGLSILKHLFDPLFSEIENRTCVAPIEIF